VAALDQAGGELRLVAQPEQRFGESIGVARRHEQSVDAVGDRLGRTARQLGVLSRVDLPGHRDDVAGELAGIDVVVAYSRSPEPFGQVVVDAMTAGRPVVAAAEGGPAETVRDGVDGLLVAPRDPVALAAPLRRLHDDPALAARLADAGRVTAQRYRPDRIGGELVQVYREALTCYR
jgi:glycosyltransferase involved in cell wall biosynthesis